MQFNPSLMPKTLASNAIFMGLEDTIDAIREKAPSERAILLKARRNRTEIKNLAENYFSHFSNRFFGEALQNTLIKMEDDTAEFLFPIFTYMLVPLNEVMKHADLRSKGTAQFIAEFSELNFNALSLNSMYCHHVPNNDNYNTEFKNETALLIDELKKSIQIFNLSTEQVAICFADAFRAVHPTIKQNFMRSFCQTAAILARKHLEDGKEIKSNILLNAVSAISCTETRCFPYI